jgi:hypothetical protein
MQLNVPAVNCYWAVLAELFLCLVDLTYEVDETFTGLGNALFWPFSELELANRARLPVLKHNRHPRIEKHGSIVRNSSYRVVNAAKQKQRLNMEFEKNDALSRNSVYKRGTSVQEHGGSKAFRKVHKYCISNTFQRAYCTGISHFVCMYSPWRL